MGSARLYPHQRKAVNDLRIGSILCGGVGTGKSRTSLAYFFERILGGSISEDGTLGATKRKCDLCVITTARKRDTKEWELECAHFLIGRDSPEPFGVNLTIDSWNNIGKYEGLPKETFFIFDEQRVVGSGAWVKSFIRIAKTHPWILLSATPGDTWMDYIPVFVANGFYRNRSEFLRKHAIYSRYTKYPKVDRWIDTDVLERFRASILVNMEYRRETVRHELPLYARYDETMMDTVCRNRWNPFDDEPIRDIAGACYLMRKVANSNPDRLTITRTILKQHPKLIVFYNYNYELEILRALSDTTTVAEWNGQKHEPIPDTDSWVYLVQYAAGAEGWNCVTTDTILFYSQNYSYKMMSQAAGRIDRLNTPFTDLYYYTILSNSPIDYSIARALRGKKTFNEKAFCQQLRFDFQEDLWDGTKHTDATRLEDERPDSERC